MNPTVTESLPIISLVMVGFCLKKLKVLKEEDGALFSRIIINVTLPCIIFSSISQARMQLNELLLLAASGFFVALVLRVLGGGVARILKLEDSVAGVVVLGCMVMSVGSLMVPVMSTTYGAEGVSRTAAFDVGNSMMASGYGFYIATQYGSRRSNSLFEGIKRIFSVPVVWAILLALVVNLAGLTIPAFLSKMINPLASANAPLAMIALGIFINFKFPRWKLAGLTVFMRMGIGFLLGQLFIWLTHMQGLDRTVVSLCSAMPIGMVPLAYAATEGLDTEFAAACISLSIIIGVILTPLLLSLY